MPDDTKNTGMKNPYPTASSFLSSVSTSPGAHRLSTMPAKNAPSTMSSPNSADRNSRATSSSTVSRRVVCDVSCWPSSMMRPNRVPWVSRGTTESANAAPATAATPITSTIEL